MDDMRETIGKNIRIIRKSKGLTLQTLSKQIGITHQQLSRIENGLGTSSTTLQRICAVLEVDMKVLIDEPESTLQNSIPRKKSYVSEQFCKKMYARLFEDVIKPTNDIVIDKFMNEVIDKLVKDQRLIRNLMCSHVGNKELYEFTPSELLKFSQQLFVDFVDYAMRLSKNELDSENT